MNNFNNNKGGEAKGETANAQVKALTYEPMMISAAGYDPLEVNPLIWWNEEIITEIKTKRNIQ
jgi:hypothetical protein